jgi:transposase
MRAIKIRGTAKKIQQLVTLSKQALREGAYRVATRLHAIILNMEGKTAPQIADILKVHRSKVSKWLRNWKEDGMEGLLEGHRSGRPPAMSNAQRQELADILDSGPVAYGFTSGVWTCPMVARVIKEEFSIIYNPAHVSRILHNIGFSVQRPRKTLAKADKTVQSRWVRYKYPNIKKSQERRGRDPLRRRSQLPARPYPLSDMGTAKFSAGSPNYGTEEYAQDLRNNRAVRCQIPLPFSKSVQCPNVHRVPRKDFTMLLSTENIYDSRQCIVP